MDYSMRTMLKLAVFCCLLPSFYITSTAAQNSGKYTDENRPYEFGFNIEGEQHRKEKKDENGLIMGEFGFITADGVYHVTVYATDENGNFRIISMKNIRLGPAPKGITRPPVVSTVVTTPEPVTFPPPPPQPVRRSEQLVFTTLKPLPIASCSHCSIPSTTQRPLPNSQFINPPPATFQPPFPNSPQRQNPSPFQQQNQNPQFNQQYNQFNQQQNPQQYSQFNQNRPPFNQNQQNFPVDNFNPAAIQRQPVEPQFPRPLLISGSITPVDPTAVIPGPRPGEQEGLPPGITVDDMVNLLYRFNYTVGFHGHYEEGYTNGDKKGEYYVNNRNGYATKISYIANERGYQPKISTVKITPIETPFQETEKDDQFGLKGYEFTWFYVPKYHFLNHQ